MANPTIPDNNSPKGQPSIWERINFSNILMYVVLVMYAIVSLFPFMAMISTSLMTRTEVIGSANQSFFQRLIPAEIDFQTDISPCILVTTDTFFDPQVRDDVTQTRVIIDISEEVSSVQGYGFRSSSADEANIIRNERFRIPFFSNYCAAWDGANLGRYMWNTVRIVAITIIGTLTFGIMAAYAFARMEFLGRDLMFSIMLATLMIPGIVVNLPNLLLLVGIDRFLETTWICAEAERCIISNWPALTVPFMAQAINIFLMRQHFATIPDELWDAARIDGAGHIRFIIQIIIPLSRPVIFVVLLFTFIGAWNELAWALLATPGDDSWRPIAVGLQQFLDADAAQPHLQMAGAMITILPILILYAFTQKQFIEGLSQSGLKG